MNKKRALLVIVLILVVGIAAGFYFFFFRNSGQSIGQIVGQYLPFGKSPSGGQAVGSGEGNGGQGNQPVGSGEANQPVNTGGNGTTSLPALREITAGPVAGFSVFSRSYTEVVGGKKVTQTETPIRYIERQTGNVYETFTDSEDLNRLTITTFPRIQEAFFTNNGNSLVLRTLGDADQIRTYVADIIPGTVNTNSVGTSSASSTTNNTSGEGSLNGYYLTDGISFIAISPDTTKLLQLNEDQNGIRVAESDYRGNSSKLVYVSAIGEWLPQWYNSGSFALNSKPSYGIPGVAISENIKSSSVSTIVGNVNGLTSLVNPAGTYALIAEEDQNGLLFESYNIKTGSSSSFQAYTLPEKCVWSLKQTGIAYCFVPDSIPSGTYPDDWYQGLVSFTDNIWKVDVLHNTLTQIYSPVSTDGVSIDGIRPMLSPDENYLVFMNKKDGSLWSLSLNP